MKKTLKILGITWLVIVGLIIWISVRLNQTFQPQNLKKQTNNYLAQISPELTFDWNNIETKYRSHLEIKITNFAIKINNQKEIFKSEDLTLVFPYRIFLLDSKGRVDAIFNNSQAGFDNQDDEKVFSEFWNKYQDRAKNDSKIEVSIPKFITRSSYNLRFLNIKPKNASSPSEFDITKIVVKDFKHNKKSGFEFQGSFLKKINNIDVRAKLQIVGEVNLGNDLSFIFDSSTAEFSWPNQEPIEAKLTGKGNINHWRNLSAAFELSSNEHIQGKLNILLSPERSEWSFLDGRVSSTAFELFLSKFNMINSATMVAPKTLWVGNFNQVITSSAQTTSGEFKLEQDSNWQLNNINYFASAIFKFQNDKSTLELKNPEGELIQIELDEEFQDKSIYNLSLHSIKDRNKLNPWTVEFVQKGLLQYIKNINKNIDIRIVDTDLVSREEKLYFKSSSVINGKKALDLKIRSNAKSFCELKSYVDDQTQPSIPFNLNAKNCNFGVAAEYFDQYAFFPRGQYLGQLNFDFKNDLDTITFTNGKLSIFSGADTLYENDLATWVSSAANKPVVVTWNLFAQKSQSSIELKAKSGSQLCTAKSFITNPLDLDMLVQCTKKSFKIIKNKHTYQLN